MGPEHEKGAMHHAYVSRCLRPRRRGRPTVIPTSDLAHFVLGTCVFPNAMSSLSVFLLSNSSVATSNLSRWRSLAAGPFYTDARQPSGAGMSCSTFIQHFLPLCNGTSCDFLNESGNSSALNITMQPSPPSIGITHVGSLETPKDFGRNATALFAGLSLRRERDEICGLLYCTREMVGH